MVGSFCYTYWQFFWGDDIKNITSLINFYFEDLFIWKLQLQGREESEWEGGKGIERGKKWEGRRERGVNLKSADRVEVARWSQSILQGLCHRWQGLKHVEHLLLLFPEVLTGSWIWSAGARPWTSTSLGFWSWKWQLYRMCYNVGPL